MILLWAMLASSWNIAGGYAGMFSLGHGAFIGIGAYASSMLFIHFKLSPWIGMIIGALAAGIVAAFLGYICGRLKGHYFALATIAFVELTNITGVQLKELTRGSEGLSIPFSPGWLNFMFESKVTYAYIGLVFAAIFYFLSLTLERSKLGYYLVAMREDEDAAKSLAINTPLVKMISIGLSGFLAAIGGTFYAQYILFIEPDTVLSFNFSVQVALVTIVGGMGTALGPIIGSFLLTPLSMLLRAYLGGGTCRAPHRHLRLLAAHRCLLYSGRDRQYNPDPSKKISERGGHRLSDSSDPSGYEKIWRPDRHRQGLF